SKAIARALKIGGVLVAHRGHADDSDRTAISIASHCRGEYRVLDSHTSPNIDWWIPSNAPVTAHCYVDMIILLFRGGYCPRLFASISKIDRIRGAAWLRRIFADTN